MESGENSTSLGIRKETAQIVVGDLLLQDALEQAVLDALRPLSSALAGIFVVFIGFNLLDLPRHAVVPVVIWDAVLVACFVGLRLALGRKLVPARWAHPVLACVAALVVSNILLTYYLLSDPFYTNYLLIVVVGGGFFLLSARWMTVLIALILIPWAVVAWYSSPPHQFVHHGFTLFAATILSFVVHGIRIRTFRRLERLRLINEVRNQELEEALNAAERELVERRLAEERYRHLVQGIDGVVWEADAETWKFTFVSDYAVELLGYPTGEWLGRPNAWLRFVHQDDRAQAAAFCHGWQQGEQAREFECRALRASGEVVWLRLIVNLVRDDEGTPRQFRGLMVDITQRRQQEEQRVQLEAQLMHAQKMEAIGRLAGGVAHDMNNMLAAIMSFASVIQEDIEPQSQLQQDVRDILKACQRGRALTQNLLGVARKGTYRKERFSLNGAVDELAELLKRTISKRIEVRKVPHEDLPDIEGDPNQIQQALINLSLNAADAMEGEGTLTFTTKYVDLDVDLLKSTPDLAAGVYVELQISDTGAGMDALTLQHAFEPFFTTKPTGEGTGLGLSMVYGTIKNHRGRVFIASQPGEGTTVTIQLPGLLSLPASLESSPKEARPRARGEGSVLLVDDEELVRRSGKRLLEQLGYRVILAENGKEALERYSQLNDQIDLVVLDLIMPVMDGHETYLKLKAIEPSVKVIFCSGFTQDEGASSLIAAPDTRFIRKPFDVEQLAAELARAVPRTGAKSTDR